MSGKLLQIQSVPIDTLRSWANTGRLYAVVDACDAPAVPPKMEALGERAVSLYRGMAEEEWSAFAPYLAQADEELLTWIQAELWEEAWGIFIVTDAGLHGLRAHLRHFLIVNDPQAEPMYFRFYDPRVLRKFLPTCSAKELQQLYGNIETFLTGEPTDAQSVQSAARIEGVWSPTPTTHRIGQRFGIRPEQMAVFGPEAEAAFEQRLIEHLQEHHAEAVSDFSDDVLLEMTRTGIARARRYGMTWESSLAAYVALMVEIAPNFDQHPRMQMILNSRQIPHDQKVEALMERIPDQTWEEVGARSDAPAWIAKAAVSA